MDLNNLSPAPWTPSVESDRGYKGNQFGRFFMPTFAEAPFASGCNDADEKEAQATTDAEFIALARNAFDVMMRRGWGVECADVGGPCFTVVDACGHFINETAHRDPFTALVEADRWYAANVEAKPTV